MKKLNLKNVYTALILLILTIIFVSCGGGAGGASIPDSEYTTHNPGGWGGGGSTGGSSGGSGGSSGETDVSVQGSTPLVVTGYSYGGQTYTSVESLTQAMTASGATGTFFVPFTTGGEIRQARVTSTEEGFLLEHQYKATCVVATLTDTTSTPVMYYANSGVDVTSLNSSTPSIIGWSANGTTHNENPVMGLQGDITLNAVFDLPECKITVTPPVGVSETEPDSGIYEITSVLDNFSFTVAMADDSPFPAGTNVTAWQANGLSAGLPGTTSNMSPGDAGITDSSIGYNSENATEFNISCIVTIPGEPQTITVNKVIRVFKKITLPDSFSIGVSKPSSAIVDISGYYAISSLTDTFSFNVSLGGGATFPTGTTFSWSISAGGTPVEKTGKPITVGPTEPGILSTTNSSPTTWTVTCTVSHADGANMPSATRTIQLYKVDPPKMTMTKPSNATETSTGIYKISDWTTPFTFNVMEQDDSPITSSTFKWYVNDVEVNGATSDTFTPAPTDFGLTEASIGRNLTSANPVKVKCVVTRPSGEAAVEKAFKVFMQYTLPSFSISVTKPTSAGVSGTTYGITNINDAFTFEVAGATYPAETSYNWTIKNAAGSTVATRQGSSINVTPSELGSIGNSESTATSFSVKCVITHDDASNSPEKTESYNFYQIQSSKLSLSSPSTLPDDDIFNKNTFTGSITFTIKNANGTNLPDGTTYQWYVNNTLLSASGFQYSPTLSTLVAGLSSIGTNSSGATPIEVKCIATRPNGVATTAVKTIKVFEPVTLPTNFSVTIAAPTVSGTTQPYPIYSNTDSFTFTASPSGGGNFPSDTKYSWQITGGSATVTRSNLTTASVSIMASEFGTISTDSTTATTLYATCTISHTDMSNATAPSKQETVQVYRYTIPNYTITFTPGTNSYDATHSDTSGSVPVYAMTDLTIPFEVKAVPNTGETPATFPAGTKFSWTVNSYSMSGGTQQTDTLSLTFAQIALSSLSTSSTSPTSFSITCTAHDDHNPALVTTSQVTKTVKVYEYVPVVTMKTGNAINTALRALGANSGSDKTFSASATPPAEGATVQLLSDTGSPVEVVAWADGANIKYYAAGYTDAGVKILLNADCAYMFDGCSKLTNIDLSGFDTSSATNMRYMFNGCQGMTSINLSYFDISNVTNIMGMFFSCSHLETIYVSTSVSTSFATTSAVGDNMFNNCYALKGGGSPQTTYSSSHSDKEYARIDDPANGLPGYFTLAP